MLAADDNGTPARLGWPAFVAEETIGAAAMFVGFRDGDVPRGRFEEK